MFHALKGCSCGKCQDDADLKCDGEDYHMRQIPMQVSYAFLSL